MRIQLLILWIVLTVYFLWTASSSEVGGAPREWAPIPAAEIDTGPIRTAMTDPPKVRIGGVEQKCSDCHALFSSLEVTPGTILQHGHIVMEHGMNGRCYNCHDRTDRNLLVQHDGSTIGYADSTQLCAKCHGTVFRDWERGMHGKTMGSWDASSGEQWRLRCVDCHDPHSPSFKPIVALPGPNTLRMGEPVHHDQVARSRNPLERWKAVLDGSSSEAGGDAEDDSH